ARAVDGGRSARAALEVCEEAGELDEQREADQHAHESDQRIVEHAVGEARRAEAGGDRCEKDDRAPLGQALQDEPMRGVIAGVAGSVPARPSMLSSRLNAFVIAMNQSAPSTAARTSLWTICTDRPPQSATAAAPPCATSFVSGDSLYRSSARPTAKRIAQPP